LTGAAFAIDGSIAVFSHRVSDGASLGSQLTGGQLFTHLFRLDSFYFSVEQRKNFTGLLIITSIAAFLASFASTAARIGSALIAFVLAGLSTAICIGWVSPQISYEPFQPMQLWAISIPIMLSALISRRRNHAWSSREGLALAFFLLALPYVYAVGTGINYWTQASRAGFFWLLCGVVFGVELAARKATWRSLTPLSAAALLVSAGVLWAAMENPYRQAQPLRLQTTATEIGSGSSKLFVSAETTTYIRDLRKVAAENGFRMGDPVIDLSGVSPGSIYAMGARAPGAAWLSAGYPGSNAFFNAAMDIAGCGAVAASWILTEPGSPDTLSFGLLGRHGIDVSRDYREVGSIRSVRAFAPVKFEQRLLKPARSLETAREACEQARTLR
jgi:hypothetical protein